MNLSLRPVAALRSDDDVLSLVVDYKWWGEAPEEIKQERVNHAKKIAIERGLTFVGVEFGTVEGAE